MESNNQELRYIDTTPASRVSKNSDKDDLAFDNASGIFQL